MKSHLGFWFCLAMSQMFLSVAFLANSYSATVISTTIAAMWGIVSVIGVFWENRQ